MSDTSDPNQTVIDYASQELETIEEETCNEEDVKIDVEEESSSTPEMIFRYEPPSRKSDDDAKTTFDHDSNASHSFTTERLKSKCNRCRLRNSLLNLDGGGINARVSLFDKEVNGFRSHSTMGVISWKDVNPQSDDDIDSEVNTSLAMHFDDNTEVHLNPLELDIRMTRVYSLIDRAQRLVFDKYRDDIIADYYKDLMHSDNVIVFNADDIDDVKDWENISSVFDICHGRVANSIRYIIVSIDVTNKTTASDLKEIAFHCLRQIKLSKSARVIISFNIKSDANYHDALNISRSFIVEQAYAQCQIESVAETEVAPTTPLSPKVNQKEYVNQPRILPPVDVPHYEFDNPEEGCLFYNRCLRERKLPEIGSEYDAVEQSGITDSEYSLRQFDMFASIVGGKITPMFLSVFMHTEFDIILDNHLQKFSKIWLELKRLKADKDKYVQNGYA